MNKTMLYTGILFGLLAVLLGAYGAHGLRPLLGAGAMHAYETGIQYQMYHALLLILLGSTEVIPPKHLRRVFYLIATGSLLFSFSLYLLSTGELSGIRLRGLGFLTPLGGLFLLVGWLYLGYAVYDSKRGPSPENRGQFS